MMDPLEFSVELDCPAVHAFDVWTTRFSMWWPAGHSVSGDPDVAVVFEARLGGRIFERTADGTEIDWGEVTHWEPRTRLGYIWHIHRDRSDATDVDVRFVDIGDSRCRVEIVHTGWERLGEDGEAWRERNLGGWSGLLPHFVAAVA